jgi:hypothetical protein
MRRLTALLFVLVALAGGCSRDSVIYGQCKTIFDCRTGQACSAAGHCEPGAALPSGVYGIELLPAVNTSAGPVRDELSEVTLGGGDVTLGFQAPVVLTGRVLDLKAAQRSISAAVTVTRTSRIGLPEATYSVEATADKGAGESAFSLRLPPTTTASDEACVEPASDCYELRAVPSELNLFPPLVERFALQSDTQRDFVLTGDADLVRVHGYIRDAALNAVGGLEVRIVDGDGRTLSSVVTTRVDSDSVGEFQLLMPSTSPAGTIWLQVSESQGNPSVPRFLFAVDGSGGDMELGDVVLLDFQAPVTVTYRVKGAATNGQNEAIEGVLVRFTSYLTAVFPLATPSQCPGDTCAVYTRQASTNAAGEVTLTLIPPGPGGYEVDILPGPNSPYSARHMGGVEVAQAGVGADFMLERKLEIRGTVVDWQGQPVGGATVAATPREVSVAADVGGGASPAVMKTADLALEESPSAMQTDAAGQFLLMLEPGVKYDFVVTPSSSSPDPVSTIIGQEFQAAGTIDIQLPEAALLAGTVAAWDGSDTAGALVRIYEVVYDGVEQDATKTAWLRGEAVATAGGAFKVLLPSGAAVVQ